MSLLKLLGLGGSENSQDQDIEGLFARRRDEIVTKRDALGR
jgi:hypothetical protein